MKILVVTQYFWPENFRINDLARGLQARGHHITVLTGIPNYPTGRLFPGYRYLNKMRDNFNGIDLIRVPLILRGTGSGIRLALNFFSFSVAAGILGPILCKGQFDVILVYEPSPISVCLPGIILKKCKAAPLMFWMQDLWPESLSAIGAIRSKVILKMVAMVVRLIYMDAIVFLRSPGLSAPQLSSWAAKPNAFIITLTALNLYISRLRSKLMRPKELFCLTVFGSLSPEISGRRRISKPSWRRLKN